MRLFGLRIERTRCKHLRHSASHILGRHYRDKTAVTSRPGFPVADRERLGEFAGQSHLVAESSVLRIQLRFTFPKESDPCLRCRRGQARDSIEAGMPGAVAIALCRARTEVPAFHHTLSQVTVCTRKRCVCVVSSEDRSPCLSPHLVTSDNVHANTMCLRCVERGPKSLLFTASCHK
jgi:hypothetical protein